MGPEGSLIIVLKVTHPGSVKLEFDVTHYTVPKIFFTKAFSSYKGCLDHRPAKQPYLWALGTSLTLTELRASPPALATPACISVSGSLGLRLSRSASRLTLTHSAFCYSFSHCLSLHTHTHTYTDRHTHTHTHTQTCPPLIAHHQVENELDKTIPGSVACPACDLHCIPAGGV